MKNEKNMNTTTARAEWESMNGNEQYKRLIRATWRMAKKVAALDDGRSVIAQIVKSDDDARAVAHEAFLRLAPYFDKADESGDGLNLVLFRACYQAAKYIYREERRNASALKTRANEDGETELYTVENAAPIAETIAPGPEHGAIIRDMIDRAAIDDIDRRIIYYIARGFTQAETARHLNMIQSTVSRRLRDIRDRYEYYNSDKDDNDNNENSK